VMDPSSKLIYEKQLYVSLSNFCNGKGLFTSQKIEQNEIIIEIIGDVVEDDLTNVHNPYALQIDFRKYIIPKNITRYINHSCDPNCKIEILNDKIVLKSIKKINEFEELTYNYNTTEYDLGVDSFRCGCKSKDCIGIVKGFKYLSLERKIKLANLILPYLKILI